MFHNKKNLCLNPHLVKNIYKNLWHYQNERSKEINKWNNLKVLKVFIGWINKIKGALSGFRQFSATESLLKMMKNVYHFIALSDKPMYFILSNIISRSKTSKVCARLIKIISVCFPFQQSSKPCLLIMSVKNIFLELFALKPD